MEILGLALVGCGVFGIIYPHVLYPAILAYLGKNVPKLPDWKIPLEELPSMAIIISAYNEAEFIGKTLTNLAQQQYAPGKIRIYVGDDGSSDNTSDVVEKTAATLGVDFIELKTFPRSGKNFVVNSLLSMVSAEVIVFADADVLPNEQALIRLCSAVQQEGVGAALGTRVPRDSSAESELVRTGSSYRKRENNVVELESRLGSTVYSLGWMYAVKARFVSKLTDNRAADDWVHLIRVVRGGERVVSLPEVQLRDQRLIHPAAEFNRVVRTIACGIATIVAYPQTLLPSMGRFSFFMWSHRMLRWMSPFFLLTILFGTLLTLSDPTLFGVLFYSQLLFVLLALVGKMASVTGITLPVIATIYFFVSMNVATAVAWLRAFSTSALDKWNPGGNHVG